jgi:Family of unknown function (DUF5706)
MDNEKRRSADGQLERVLSFFPRVDTKISILIGINLAMLGYLAVHLTPIVHLVWYALFAVAACVALAVSMWFLYKASFPNLRGGHDSLIFFGTISQMTEHEYITDFIALDDAAYSSDVLGQVHRNSQILAAKYQYIQISHISLMVGAVFWVLYLSCYALLFVSKMTLVVH